MALTADLASYEIPFGAIDRPTQSDDPHQQAKWEVPGLRWADLSDGRVGLSLLTDYKHGFDAQPDQLRVTLLKAPLWPDPKADRGQHRFTYALYPHGGDWRQARTPHWAIALGTGVRSHLRPPVTALSPQASPAPSQGSWLAIESETVHLAALKQAEADPQHYVLRCWEMYGQAACLSKTLPPFERTNLLEQTIALPDSHGLAPWQIATLKLAGWLPQAPSAADAVSTAVVSPPEPASRESAARQSTETAHQQ